MKRKTTEPTETSKFEISPSLGDAISRRAALAFNRDIDLKTTVKNVSLWALKPFKNHPYRLYDETKMAELAESIRENGVISPILIRPTEGPNYVKTRPPASTSRSPASRRTDAPSTSPPTTSTADGRERQKAGAGAAGKAGLLPEDAAG